ncbi:hypothetical protein IDJ75_09840 [Mucilaginibacter rigui]|uniref:Adhesin domain-containing protein n=1 Tax=Mucilaginibacter rigui TaxID=534635 RepID=A0ABR7X6X9_9SPHI|nr:hypothetical protein [Mucilaginibacter rigui]MBD1385577.1 hypothetical protein [Mucilaginibacter rigui]
MKTKIFKHALLTIIAVLAISTGVSAQDSLAVPPMPPIKLKVYKFKDDKAFKQNMADLKVKMKQLQRQMQQKKFKMDMKFAFKDFDKSFKDFGKNFNDSFKDFGKNFSGSFSEMSPNFSGSFKNLNGVNYSNNNNADNEEYKQKIASGEMIEKVKNYSKSYPADGNDVLQISNTFGKVVVNTWAKKEFKVDVQMKFSADDEEYVNNMIEGSSISDSKDGSIVSFKTNLARINNRRGSNHIEINYTVYMPAGNALDLTNTFGSTVLPDLSGKVTIVINYGSLIAQQLTNSENDIRIKFSQNGPSSIALLNGGKFKLEYGKLKAGIFNNVDADISFSTVSVDKLKNSASFRVRYGDGVNIGMIDRSVKNININASFSKIKLDFKDSESFKFDVITKLGSFNYNDDNIKITAKTPSDEERGWSSTKTYKGYIGKDNSDGKITIHASFTDVKFQ